MNNQNKTISIMIEETKNEIIKTINESNLPASVLQYIINDIFLEIKTLARQEYQEDMIKYKQAEEQRLDDNDIKE